MGYRAALFVLGIGVLAAPAAASTSNPPDIYLNMSGMVSCTACHMGGMNAGPGSIKVEGIPASFVPGQKYPVTVTISQSGINKFGFELMAVGPDGKQAGRIITDALDIDVRQQAGVTFVKQSYNGTAANGGNQRTWQFQWEAPDTATPVTVRAQGVAADGGGTVVGDFSYNTELHATPAGLNVTE